MITGIFCEALSFYAEIYTHLKGMLFYVSDKCRNETLKKSSVLHSIRTGCLDWSGR